MDGKINDVKNFFTLVFYAAVPVLFIIYTARHGNDYGMFLYSTWNIFCIRIGYENYRRRIGISLPCYNHSFNSSFIPAYQKSRFTGFLNPEADYAGNGYHLTQSLIGIGSGGIFGSRPSLKADASTGYAAQNVPEVHTDFIFSAIAEQLGMLGAIFLLILYGFLIYEMISIARTSKDICGSVICVGIVSYFLLEIIQNIGMTIGLLPITGITLPLISYGGSSLLQR